MQQAANCVAVAVCALSYEPEDLVSRALQRGGETKNRVGTRESNAALESTVGLNSDVAGLREFSLLQMEVKRGQADFVPYDRAFQADLEVLEGLRSRVEQ